VQRNARKQRVRYLHNLVSHTKCPSPWSITIKLFWLQPYQPISKYPYNKASECKRHTYGIYNSHKPHCSACHHKGTIYVCNNISPSHPTLSDKKMHINAHELLSLYPSRCEATYLCQTNDVCIWMYMNSCLHTQQGMKLHRYAQ